MFVERPTEQEPLLGSTTCEPTSDGHDEAGDAEGQADRPGNDHGDSDGEQGQGIPLMAKRMHLLVPALGVGVFLVGVDQLLPVAIGPKIGNDLNALNNISWISTSYLLTLTSFQPMYGRLSDVFGRKACLLFAYVVFGVGCFGCGVAPNFPTLCCFRALAGIGGGGMNSIVVILLSDILPLRERGLWQSYFNVIFAAGTSASGPLGGLLADSLGWRWSFLIQVPICLIAWFAVWILVELPSRSWTDDKLVTKLKRLDFSGALTLVLAVFALLVGLDFGPNLGWSNVGTVIFLTVTVPLFALFVLIETRFAVEPFAPGRVIFNRKATVYYIATFFGQGGYVAILFFIPLYFQAVKEYSAAKSGLLLVPVMVIGVLASIGTGWIMKKTGRLYWAVITSYSILFLGVLLLLMSVWLQNFPGQLVSLILTGIGGGCAITVTTVGILANVDPIDNAVAIGCSYLFRSLGSSVGIGVSFAVLQQMLRSQLAMRLHDTANAGEIEEKVRQSIDYIRTLPIKVALQVRLSYQIATFAAIGTTTLFVTVSLIATFWVKERYMKT